VLDVREMTYIYRQAREMELMLRLFNLAASYVVFTAKLCSITNSVNYLFFGIRLYLTHPLIATIFATIGMYVLTPFVVLFGKAFSLPNKMADLKTELVLAARQLKTCDNRALVKMRMKSIANVGINAGNFQILGRTSTPTFIDFITQQVCSLLLTF